MFWVLVFMKFLRKALKKYSNEIKDRKPRVNTLGLEWANMIGSHLIFCVRLRLPLSTLSTTLLCLLQSMFDHSPGGSTSLLYLHVYTSKYVSHVLQRT